MSWAKLHTDILADPKLSRISRKSRKNLHLTLLPWLIVFAKLAEDSGRITVNGEPAEPEDIAPMIPETTPAHVETCMAALVECGILIVDEDGASRFPAWSKRNDHKPSDNTAAVRERVRKYRAKKSIVAASATNPADDVTPCNALHVTPCNAPIKNRIEKKRVDKRRTEQKRSLSGADAPTPKSREAKWPHFAPADCDRLWTAWKALGFIPYARFRNVFGPLFGETPAYSVDQLERAIRGAIDDARADARSGNEKPLQFLSPERFIEKVQYWVEFTSPIAQVDPARSRQLGILA